MVKDLTQGKPSKVLWLFCLPLLVSTVFQQLYNMADSIIAGKVLGEDALAAVGASYPLTMIFTAVALGVNLGCSVVISKLFGEKKIDELKTGVSTVIIAASVLGVVMTLVGVLSGKAIMQVLGTPANIMADCMDYLYVYIGGFLFVLIYNVSTGIFAALGDSKTPLIFLVVASGLNIILDFVFILTFKMGVAGAAWATVVSQLVAGVWCFIYARKHFRHIMTLSPQAWRLDPKFAWEHLRVAVPMGTQFLIIAIGSIILQSQLNTLGEVTIAAYTAACRADQLAIQPFLAFSIALSTYVAQNYGAGRMDRIILGIKQCIKLSVTVSIIGGIMIIIFNRQITMMFFKDADPELLRESGWFLTFNAVFYSVLAMLFILRNSLQAMGRAFAVLASGIVELFCRSFTAFYLIANFGFFGACFANIGAWWGAAIMLAIIYFKTMREEQGTFNVSHTRIRDSRI